ncbi:MAG: hypothetical protein AB1798_09090 [Spirochaetota bacterium]
MGFPGIPGISTGGHGIEMTALDAARFGYLFLRSGDWNGKQIIPKLWVDESSKIQSEGHMWFGRYGYQWWINTVTKDNKNHNMFFAMGYGGQYIFVIPDFDLVVIFISWMPGEDSFRPMRYLQSYIIKAMQ